MLSTVTWTYSIIWKRWLKYGFSSLILTGLIILTGRKLWFIKLYISGFLKPFYIFQNTKNCDFFMSFALLVCLSNTGRDHRVASDLYNINTCPRKERLSYESIRQNLFHTVNWWCPAPPWNSPFQKLSWLKIVFVRRWRKKDWCDCLLLSIECDSLHHLDYTSVIAQLVAFFCVLCSLRILTSQNYCLMLDRNFWLH